MQMHFQFLFAVALNNVKIKLRSVGVASGFSWK